MHIARYVMQREHAPPGFWRWPDACKTLEGVELESAIPTRFFQTVDQYPRAWGRLSWRVQLNKLVEDRAELPLFRTFYPGVEWKLNSTDARWFLTAWFLWELPGDKRSEPQPAAVAGLDDGVVSFAISRADPDSGERLYLRSRIDARDRHSVAETVQQQREGDAPAQTSVILIDDLLDLYKTK